MRRLPPAPAGDPAPVRPLGALVTDNWVPILGLLFLAAIQNLDVIVARHVFEGDAAGSYAAASVAAKAVVWVAIGVGLQLLPEATRRAAAGLDPRPTLLRALALLAVIAAPALVIFAAVPHLLLKVAFGPDLAQASGALPILGVAMTVFAVAYLTVQYLVALGEPRFVPVIGVLALAEPFVLAAGHPTLTGFAAIVLAVQLVVAAGVLGLALRGRRVPALVPAAPRAGARR
jgi:O-antigen/teichoic acid export membrane protein